MNEKDRHEQLNATLSLNIIPLIKDTRRRMHNLFLLNLLGTIILTALVSGLIVLVLTLEV